MDPLKRVKKLIDIKFLQKLQSKRFSLVSKQLVINLGGAGKMNQISYLIICCYHNNKCKGETNISPKVYPTKNSQKSKLY